ncbi:MAG TPA: thioesterase family protein [Chloroflexia bacterium]|nr:thioesterase family protein [Chloroflexia bacterium]
MAERRDALALFEQVTRLPRTYEAEVPPEYLDLNGHMNVMYYTHVGNLGLGKFFSGVGIYSSGTEDTYHQVRRGMFALKQIISYLNELREGEKLAVHSGMVDYDSKRMHFFHYIVSLTYERVAAVDERLAMYVDLGTRRSTSFEPHILRQLEEMRLFYAATGWQPELSGAIKLKERPALD